MDELIQELTILVDDLADWEVQRMSSSGAETVDEIYRVINKLKEVINNV